MYFKLTLFSFFFFLFSIPASAKSEADIQFPISELGSCSSKQSCMTFCDRRENMSACLDFAARHNLMSKQEIEMGKKLASSNFRGPAGCATKSACEAICEKPENHLACVDFALKNNMISEEDAAIARRIPPNAATPGRCRRDQCKEYCNNSAHAEECLVFAEKYNIIPTEELAEAREMMRRGITSGPGGCRSKRVCEAYCMDPSHSDECVEFGVRAGFISPSERDMVKKFMRMGFRGGPGGCRSKASCESFCKNPEHADECVDFAVKMGMMSPEQAEQARRMMRAGITSGPGGCRGQEECEAYCNSPERRDECMDFAVRAGMMTSEEAGRMREFERNKNDSEDNDAPRGFEADHQSGSFETNDAASDLEVDNFDEFSEPQSRAAPSRNKLTVAFRRLFDTDYVGAQSSSKLSDLTITKATLDGAALRFKYHNRGEGDAEPSVSFWYEWIDGQGRRIGDVHWINVGGMRAGSDREGNQLNDFADLDSEHGKVKLANLIYSPPRGAYHFKLTIDGPNKHTETNEQNNSVLLPVLRTDFIMTDAEFRNDLPWFKYHNRGNLGFPEGKKISFWFEWVDARGARVDDLHWIDVEPPAILSSRSSSLARSTSFDSTTTVFSAKGTTKLTTFLSSAPNGATHLKITIDGSNAYAESHEGNNFVLLKRLYKLGADLTVGNVIMKDRVLHVTVRNIGKEAAPWTNLVFMWMGTEKAPMPYLLTASWTVDQIAAGSEIVEKIAMDGLGQVNKILREYPKEAARLRISVDGDERLVESKEDNNVAYLDRSELEAPTKPGISPPPSKAEKPRAKLSLALTTDRLEARAGESVSATLAVKNIGQANVSGLSLSLPCPRETSLKKLELNSKERKSGASRWFPVSNLDQGAVHRLTIVCTISKSAAVKGKLILKFAGAAYQKEGNQTLQSNNVVVTVLRPMPKPQLLETKSKLEPQKAPSAPEPKPLEPEPLQAFPRQDLTTDADFRF